MYEKKKKSSEWSRRRSLASRTRAYWKRRVTTNEKTPETVKASAVCSINPTSLLCQMFTVPSAQVWVFSFRCFECKHIKLWCDERLLDASLQLTLKRGCHSNTAAFSPSFLCFLPRRRCDASAPDTPLYGCQCRRQQEWDVYLESIKQFSHTHCQ